MKKLRILSILFLITSLIVVPAGHSITIQQERELAREFMAFVNSQFPLIKDPIIVGYVNHLGNRILEAFPPQPFEYKFYVLQEDVYNAFATPAGHIFFNSGLFAALESEEELAGIIGHEIAHVVCRHISDRIENSKKISMATLAGMAAGVLLGASGAGEAGSALTMGSMAAGQTAVLAYSRENEKQADQLGLKYLNLAGYTGEGLLTSLEKIRSKQWYGTEQVPTYLNTHPGSEERMSYIDNWLHQHTAQEVKKRPETGGFELAHTRLVALYTDEKAALSRFKAKLAVSPGDAMAHYGYALVLTRMDQWHAAAASMKRAIEADAMATHMLQDLGIIYYNDGQFEKALEALTASRSEKNPDALLYLGRTQMELDRMADARDTFEDLIHDYDNYTQAYYYLGESSGRLGDMFGAHYNLGRFYQLKGDRKNAGFHLKKAMDLAPSEADKQMAERQLNALPTQKSRKKGSG
jgi:predicted Zn-dependent protease